MTEPDPTTHDPKAEGIDHLQRAAREMVAAARSFLDAIEQVVEDRETLKEVSTTVTGLAVTVGEALGDAVRGGRPAPWVDAAWAAADERPAAADERPAPADEPAGDEEGSADADEAGSADPDGDAAVVDVDDTEDWARPLVDPDAPRRPSRVRRIAVD